MSNTTTQSVQLQLTVDEDVIHDITDQLMTFGEPLKFSMQHIRAYHAEQLLSSTEEQVTGYSIKVRVDILATEQNFQAIIDHAKLPLHNSALEYVLLPVLAFGSC